MGALSDQQFSPPDEYYEMKAPGPTQGMVQVAGPAGSGGRRGAYTREELTTYPQMYREDPGAWPEMAGTHSPGSHQQGTLLHWDDVKRRNIGVRQNMARRMAPSMTQSWDDGQRLVQDLGSSQASRADLHEVAHSAPSVTWDPTSVAAMGQSEGMYWHEDHDIQIKPHGTPETLYHELGHALHIQGDSKKARSAILTRHGDAATAELEGPADGFMDRLSGKQGLPSYRDSDHYQGWGEQGQARYEASRGDWAQPGGGRALSLDHQELLRPKLGDGQSLVAEHMRRSEHSTAEGNQIRHGYQSRLF